MIVTDVAGREPLVVLSLADYERLIDQEKPIRRTQTPIQQERAKALSTLIPPVIQEIAEKQAELEEASLDLVKDGQANSSKESDLSLEERFYLEPVDEEEEN